ncbi:hypothetical protein GMES_4107 [Paraglaciecola mesophila KMM 241]|uniref:Uncharacterized protein n=1 Tax=Paraglaciecola mesophila KMM 241 TaxID=1128912 RepID=K6ZSU0_9ALTE|nr:hypothetical protein GMES_4107 [Paraglaciecola mesophila KMM 241]
MSQATFRKRLKAQQCNINFLLKQVKFDQTYLDRRAALVAQNSFSHG